MYTDYSTLDHRKRGRPPTATLLATLWLAIPALLPLQAAERPAPPELPATVLIGQGDSLTHGTLDAIVNATNTQHGYLQRVADALGEVTPLVFSQPLIDDDSAERIDPFRVPTNLAVDGADAFSVEGLQYYKRVGAGESYLDEIYLCDKFLPPTLDDLVDKVLYPTNLVARSVVSSMDSTEILLDAIAARPDLEAALVFWVGNNDTSTAALGQGGENPTVLAMPFDLIKDEFGPALRLLLTVNINNGTLSVEPYTQALIDRNMTDLADFEEQYRHLLDRLGVDGEPPNEGDLFVLTLPYYNGIGYLMDADDLEFYLRKLDPTYLVPATFQRPRAEAEADTSPVVNGDRVSLLTFGFMYALLGSGYSVDYVNQALEQDGVQRDGQVLSESEQQSIVDRIDGFNQVIKNEVARVAANAGGPRVHLVDVGQRMNDFLTGDVQLIVDGYLFERRWGRGNAFSMDGVHPGYTVHALIANEVIAATNDALGLEAEPYDLAEVLAVDPYVDKDRDGWVPGPDYRAVGFTELLFLFRDPDDQDPNIGAVLPADVWQQMTRIILQELLGIDSIRASAQRLGIRTPHETD